MENPREWGDFLKTFRGDTTNLIEVNDDGNLIASPLDENGEHHWMSVGTFEPSDVDFVRRWDEASVIQGSGI